MTLKDSILMRYRYCNEAFESLHDVIKLLEKTDEVSQQKEYLAFQDSVIKRFEYSLDVLWKYVKEYLLDKFGVTVKSPKETFREAFKQNLLSKQNTELALDMVDDRNETSHRYDCARAREISDKIPAYYEVLVALLKKTKPD